MTRFRSTYRAGAALVLSILSGASGASAQTPDLHAWMSRDEIIAAFAGQQLSGIYPGGTSWRELIRRDGTSDYREGGARRDGRWWMRGDQFCFSYALPQSGGCFLVVAVGRNCYELYAVGRGGGAEPPVPNAQRHWNGRMWREDIPATCEEAPLV